MLHRPVETIVQRDHFARLVRHWSHFGPPLRPTAFDTGVVQEALSAMDSVQRAVVLGLTPETMGCAWPHGTRLLALDHSLEMLRSLWPQAAAPSGSEAIMASWLAMPLADASVDLVCADGCHTQLAYPAGFRRLTSEVWRVLRPGGRLVARVFVRPDRAEPLARIAEALAEGSIPSVHALKLRLLAALHGKTGVGTCLNDVWKAWRQLPRDALTGRPGWSPDELAGIEGYGGLATRYYLPTLQELRALHAPDFAELACRRGEYASAELCPTLVLERHARPDATGHGH